MKHLIHSYSRRQFLTAAGATSLGFSLVHGATAGSESVPAKRGQERVFGLRFSRMDKVRIGFIGVGNRGSSLLGNLLEIAGVEIRAVCDVVADRVKSAQRRVAAKGKPEPAGYAQGETAFEGLCRRDDLDLVYIATPWDWHVRMAVSAMKPATSSTTWSR